MKERPTFLNGWSLKDILILAGILGGIIHNTSTTSDIAKEASDSVAHGINHIDERIATIVEHQVGEDHALSDHETRIRKIEDRR